MATMKRRVDRLLSSQTAVGGRRPEAVTIVRDAEPICYQIFRIPARSATALNCIASASVGFSFTRKVKLKTVCLLSF